MTPNTAGKAIRLFSRSKEPGDAPREALDALLHQAARELRAPVQGFVWETQDLDKLEFPRELLQRGDLTIRAAVTYYRAVGGAWGQYVVLFVVVGASKMVV